ncbi:MAG: hypothetical protein ACJZ12_02490 [Candidatus Neomarinimicrobiota bacterium]
MLVLPSSAQELTIGSHATLAGLFPVNPALYSAANNNPYLALNRGNWYGDVSLTQIGYNISKNNKIIHVGLKYMGLTDLEFRGEIPQDDASSNFSAYGLVMDTGVAFKNEQQKYGVSISFLQFGLYTEYSKGLSIDFGYVYNTKNDYSFGISAKHIGKMTRLIRSSPKLPNRLSLGLSKKINFNNLHNKIFCSVDWNSIVSTSKVYIGNKFSWKRLDILAGYSMSQDIMETSLGIGLNMNRYQLIYGLKIGSQGIGVPKILSLNILMP